MDERVTRIQQEFAARYAADEHDSGRPCGVRVFRAPGRVNLLGEHTDYNDGFVLPIAIDRDVTIAARLRRDRTVRLYSLDFEQETEFPLDDIQPSQNERWSNYVRGVALCLEQQGKRLSGMDAVLQGNVPIASGLSSSAAMEVGFALTFQCLNRFEMGGVEMALLSQKAEHEFIGVKSGIMDQYISRMGKAGHALLIDCRSLESRAIPLSASNATAPERDRFVFIVGDTKVRRELAGSEYNVRRQQCEEAVRLLQPVLPGIRALRDVSSTQLAANAGRLPEIVLKRARHVVSEDERVLQAVPALEAGDLETFGKFMNASHDSLRDDYQVSCAELDTLVDAARSVAGVLGSRMTGAGFGGCTVSLARESALSTFEKVVAQAYEEAFHTLPSLYVCQATDGAQELIGLEDTAA